MSIMLLDEISGIRHTPWPGAPDPTVGLSGRAQRELAIVEGKPIALATGTQSALSLFAPNISGLIRAIAAQIVLAGAGAGGTGTLTVRINGVATTGGAVTVALASAILDRIINGTDVTAANGFTAADQIDFVYTQGVAYTAGFIVPILLVEGR